MPHPTQHPQAGVASPHQPLLVWIRSMGVALRVTSLVPANAPVVRLVRGTEVYVAPRLRVRSSAGDGAAGDVLQQQRAGADGGGAAQQTGKGEDDAAAAPLQAVLRVQQVSDAAAAQAAAAAEAAAAAAAPEAAAAAAAGGDGGQPPPPPPQEALPPSVQRAFASAPTLAQCGLRPGDWVRLSGRDCRSLIKFACVSASEAAAPGHLVLTAAQCSWAGAPPRTPIRLQRLTPSQRQLIVESAEAQRSDGGNGNGGIVGSELVGRGASRSGLQQQQERREQREGGAAQHAEVDDDAAAASVLASCGWLRQGAEQALQRLLPVLGFTPRSLLQVRRDVWEPGVQGLQRVMLRCGLLVALQPLTLRASSPVCLAELGCAPARRLARLRPHRQRQVGATGRRRCRAETPPRVPHPHSHAELPRDQRRGRQPGAGADTAEGAPAGLEMRPGAVRGVAESPEA